jgi:hypothetical protein
VSAVILKCSNFNFNFLDFKDDVRVFLIANKTPLPPPPGGGRVRSRTSVGVDGPDDDDQGHHFGMRPPGE